MQKIFIFIDDSGSLHRNAPDDYFVYAGYLFIDEKSKEDAKRKYKTLNKKIHFELGRNDELKACNLNVNHKRALYNVMRNEYSFDVVVNIPRVYNNIMADKKSIVRFKDYVLKRAIKQSVQELIVLKEINPFEDLIIYISIDEQLTCTNGFYTLEDSILEELKYGIYNNDYGTFHQPIIHSNLCINVKFCDSKTNYLVQASDILANRVFTSYRTGKLNLRQKNKRFMLTLP